MGKIKDKLKRWSDELIKDESKYWVVNKVSRFLGILLVNRFTLIITTATTSFILFGVSFIIDDKSIVGDYIFLMALIMFLTVFGTYFIVGLFYVFRWLIGLIINKGE